MLDFVISQFNFILSNTALSYAVYGIFIAMGISYLYARPKR